MYTIDATLPVFTSNGHKCIYRIENIFVYIRRIKIQGGEKKNDIARNNYHDKTFQNHIKTYPSFLNYISIINNEETNYIAIINWNTRNNFLFGLDPSFTLDSEYRNSTI